MFPLLIAVVITLIADFDRPRHGLIASANSHCSISNNLYNGASHENLCFRRYLPCPTKRTREGDCSKPNKTYEAKRQQEETVITESEKRRRRSTRARNIG